MVDIGVLVTFPVESIAVRVVLASAAGVVLVRLLLVRADIRWPSARVATAMAPGVALLVVLLASSGRFDALPAVMLPADAIDALPMPVQHGYVHFAPMALPLLVALWAVVAASLIIRRCWRLRAACREAQEALAAGTTPPRLVALTGRLARHLKVPPPAVAVVATCPGGASIVGSHRPVMLVGQDLLARLDTEELEGVLAHELAHIRRRDNLIATVLGMLRDLTFFVPGGGWAIRQLHCERERAADQAAVRITGRPGALASGLLKVLERGAPAIPCAAFAPSSSLVDRIDALVDERPAVGRVRRSTEAVAVAVTAGIAVLLALVAPGLLAGAERERDAVAFLWSGTTAPDANDAAPSQEARVFDVYRRARMDATAGAHPVAAPEPDDGSAVDRRSTLRACLTAVTCPHDDQGPGLGLAPRPRITVDAELTRRWTAGDAVFSGGDAALLPQVYWLQRVQ